MNAVKVQILPLRKSTPSSSSSSNGDGVTPRSFSSFSEDQADAPKKKRTSKPKTRSGCVTCKIRRVKCDEAKPACKRCTSTGRKCDGYAVKPRKKRARSEPRDNETTDIGFTPRPSLELITDASFDELRSLDFYHHKTGPALSSYFDSEFWLRLVFQMSHVEPAVKHAMVALGALHEQRERGLRTVSETPVVVQDVTDADSPLTEHCHGAKEEFALIQYGKAITHLSSRLNSASSIEVALLTCILFVCVEFLRGDAKQAVSHFKGGMNIALSMAATNGITTVQADAIQRIQNTVWPFLNRLELLSIIDGEDLAWTYPVELLEAVPDRFESIREARNSFVHLANLTIRFIRDVKEQKYKRFILPDELARQAALLRQMDVWAETLDQIVLSGDLTEQEMDAVKTLRMHQVIGSLWLRRCTIPEETASDESMADFEIAMSLAEAIHSVRKKPSERNENNVTMFFDMQIISPVFFIASTCRHPQIRRRAIALLRQTTRQEGLWDSAKAAAAAERIMYHEEINLTTLDGSELPAEKDRIHGTHVESELGVNPKNHILTLKSLPDGLNGEWKTVKEKITLP